MDRDRTSEAVRRIEAALDRIEVAARRPRDGGESELAELRGRHELLRAAVRDGLTQIDELIETTHG